MEPTARTDIAPQDQTVILIETESTEIVTETATAVAEKMTEETAIAMTTGAPPAMMTTVLVETIVFAMKSPRKTVLNVLTGLNVAVEAEALQSGGRPLRKVPFHSLSEGEKLPDGTSMRLAMSSIQPCKQNKQVFSTFPVPTEHRYLQF